MAQEHDCCARGPFGQSHRDAVLRFEAGSTPTDSAHLWTRAGWDLEQCAPESGLCVLRCPAGELAERAGEHPLLALLDDAWRQANAPLGPVALVGIVNVTPDSFSDGGAHPSASAAVEHGLRLVEEGATLLDVGGESTRPGARAVGVEEELERVSPVIEGLVAATRAPVCVDTSKAAVARQAIALGASLVNDVSAGLADAEMLPLVAERDVGYVLMHMQGKPADMQDDPRYADCPGEVRRFLRARTHACLKAGIAAPRIAIDPGIGFGKRLGDNLQLLAQLAELRSLGLPLYLGPSRKTFIGELTGVKAADQRILGTAGAVAACVLHGADLVRVHDVAAMREAAAVACGVAGRELMDPSSDSRAPLTTLWRRRA